LLKASGLLASLLVTATGVPTRGRSPPQLRDAGFEHIRMDAYPFATIQLIPDAYGGSLVPLLEQYVAEQGGMSQEEATAWAMSSASSASAGSSSSPSHSLA